MPDEGRDEGALGTARGRFLQSLPRKAVELKGAIALLAATPDAEGPREEMRRRLHTLYASALVFRNESLASAVKAGLDRLDAARDANRALEHRDLEALAGLVSRLPELKGAPDTVSNRPVAPSVTPSGVPSVVPSVVPSEAPGGSLSDYPTNPPQAADVRTANSRVLSDPPATQAASGRAASSASKLGAGAPVSFGGEGIPKRRTAKTLSGLAPVGGSIRASRPAKPSSAPLLQMVVQVLVLDRHEGIASLRSLLPTEGFELTTLQDPEQALVQARSKAPDVVLADRELAQAGDFIRRLRSDPLTDFVPVVLMQNSVEALDPFAARETGADEALTRPLEADGVVRAIGRVTGTLVNDDSGLATMGDATLEEVADRVASEVRRGIVDAAETGRDLRVPLAGGAEVLAAAWAAVARVRAFVARQSGGRVRFSDRPLRGGPALLALVDGEQSSALQSVEATLEGRRILVADDDPSVVWFFAGLLREEGATVLESHDGAEALELARGQRPDVIISDVLMPNLDGFGLCRALKKDPALADVPVILISWKEDLLHRMRELSAGASGYLRKEAGASQILAKVREALQSRSQLEDQLTAGGEVRGNLEDAGVVPLLRSVNRTRKDARVTIRDAWNLFEAELRDGKLASLSRTASDGSFSRGERALPQLLGSTSGRFTITDAQGDVKPQFKESLDETLQRGSTQLGALIDAVSGASLMKAQRVLFDEDSFSAVVKQSPTPLRELIEKLHDGVAPSQLLMGAGVSAQALESVLIDLARRGAINGVTGPDGVDLVESARAQREERPPTELSSPASMAPPSGLEQAALDGDADEALAASAPLPTVLDPSEAKPDSEQPGHEGNQPGPGEAPAERDSALESAFESELQSELQSALESTLASTLASEPPSEPESAPGSDGPDTMGEAFLQAVSMPPAGEDDTTDAYAPMDAQQAQEVVEQAASAVESAAPPLMNHHPDEEAGPSPTDPSALALEASEAPPPVQSDRPSSQPPASEPPTSTPPSSAPAPAAEESQGRLALWGWIAALLALGAVGFVVERVFEPNNVETGQPRAFGAANEPQPQPAQEQPPAAVEQEPPGPAPTTLEVDLEPVDQGNAAVTPAASGFEIYEGILDPQVPIQQDQGLLVVEAAKDGAPVALSVGDKPVGSLPAKVPLSEGIHELVLKRGDSLSFRFLSVRPGKTWILRNP